MSQLFINVWNCHAEIVVQVTSSGHSTTHTVECNISERDLVSAIEEQGGAINMSGLYPVGSEIERRIPRRKIEEAYAKAVWALEHEKKQAQQQRERERAALEASLRLAQRAVQNNPRWLEAARAWDGVTAGGGSLTEPGSTAAANKRRSEFAEQFADLGVAVMDGWGYGNNQLVVPEELVAVFRHRQSFGK